MAKAEALVAARVVGSKVVTMEVVVMVAAQMAVAASAVVAREVAEMAVVATVEEGWEAGEQVEEEKAAVVSVIRQCTWRLNQVDGRRGK